MERPTEVIKDTPDLQKRRNRRILVLGLGTLAGLAIGGAIFIIMTEGTSAPYPPTVYLKDSDFTQVDGFKLMQYTPRELLLNGDISYYNKNTQELIQRIENICGIEGQLPPETILSSGAYRSVPIHTTSPNCLEKLVK